MVKNWKEYKKAIKNIAAAKYNEHQITFDTSKMMHSMKYQYAPMAPINLFSSELVNRRHDENNLPESFFPTDITLNKMPRAWNSLSSAY